MNGLPSSLGVDLVEIKKAKSFYERHKENLSSFFTAREILEIKESKKPHVELALCLAAKEAVFKARGAVKTRVGMLRFRRSRLGRKTFQLSFIKKKDYVIALAS